MLVTGDAGFIRGHVSQRLIERGHDVTVLDVIHPYYDLSIKRHTIETSREAATGSDGSYEFVEGDIRDQETVETLVEDAEFIYHQAGQADVRDSVAECRPKHPLVTDSYIHDRSV